MPYFIDSHKLNGDTPTELVAQKHLHDLQIQHRYNCRKLGYWFDEIRKIAFCLFEAANRSCIEQLHEKEHANVPNRIFEVDSRIIDFFLKQIELQTETQKVEIANIAPGPLITIMALSIESIELYSMAANERRAIQKNFKRLLVEYSDQFEGTIIKRDHYAAQVTFDSVSAAVNCALKMHKDFTPVIKNLEQQLFLKAGISGCFLNNNDSSEFDQAVKLAKRLCYISTSKILITLEVRNLFQSESMKIVIKGNRIQSVSPDDIRFLTELMNYMEKHWQNHDLHAALLERQLGCSKSQIYRRMKLIIGQSPNSFIKAYRLSRAKELLRNKSGNISEIAFDTGFSSPSYFSKCFQNEFGIKPSYYQMEF